MKYTEYFSLPLKECCGKVFTSKGFMAFDFFSIYGSKYKNSFVINEKSKGKVVDILNGVIEPDKSYQFIHKQGIIYIIRDEVEREFIQIRGWGSLTGCGGMGLDGDIASKMQDDFAEFIIERLTLTE